MFCPLDQILIDEKCPELNNVLMEISKIANIVRICDDKGTMINRAMSHMNL